MTGTETYIAAGLLILALMTLLWLLSLALKNASIVDAFWGAGFVIANWLYFALCGDAGRAWLSRRTLLGILVTVWGARLSLHILRRNHGKGEDFRYRKWREEAGPSWWWRSYFKVFLLQGVLMWIISAPLLAAQGAADPSRWNALDSIATAVWIVGFFFEAAGDRQLARFKSDPSNRGRVLRSGVWRCSRHPNYFGDAAQWWAYYLFAAAAGGSWTIFSPVLMTYFLLRVSGVALLEKTLVASKPGYKEYVETTSAFFPWPPRRPR